MGVLEGHRARLKRRFDSEGLDGFQPHEALELLLFQTVTRRDVNPLAHE
jgi:DNA repair protein RadC